LGVRETERKRRGSGSERALVERRGKERERKRRER
jgi:hypothetical protein